MTSDNKFGLLRRLLRTLGLSQQAADDVVNFIVDLLAGEPKTTSQAAPLYPYHLREDFLSAAELNFFNKETGRIPRSLLRYGWACREAVHPI